MWFRGGKTVFLVSVLVIVFCLNLIVHSQYQKCQSQLKLWTMKNSRTEIEQRNVNENEKTMAAINAFD